MITIKYQGRLGNNLIQYFAGRILADKFNFYLNSFPNHINNNWGQFFNISKPVGTIKGTDIVVINDNNFMDYLNNEKLPCKHYILDGFFQTSSFLHKYSQIIQNYLNIQYQPVDKKQVFVAYRIGDVDGLRQMLPKEYFEEALSCIDYPSGYITSDTINHRFVTYLSEKYNLKKITFERPLEKINFAKNFNQLILSEGTFSWWIGFLSQAETVIYNKRDYDWFGRTIFDFPNWKYLSWDYKNNQPFNIQTSDLRK